MIDVTIENFEAEVIAASMTQPVMVDFWAPWCGPCKQLTPILEKAVKAAKGKIKLAKMDIDKHPEIPGQMGIQSIPAVVAFSNGQPVDGFMGALPEGKIREFLDKHLPPADEAQPEELADDGADAADPAARMEKLQHAVATDPANDDARFEYVRALLHAGRDEDARVAFAPVASKTALVRRFDSLQRVIDARDFASAQPDVAQALAGLEARVAANKRDFAARFDKARLLIARRQWTAAMDELLEILMRDKAWSEDLARKTYIAVLDIIEPPRPKVAEGQIPPDDPVVASYRRRLSSVVLS
jgi:putative thioredoxin